MMSLQWRLSILYSSVLALTLIIFGAVLYLTQSRYTINWLRQDLVISSETLSQTILQKYGIKPPLKDAQSPSGPAQNSKPPSALEQDLQPPPDPGQDSQHPSAPRSGQQHQSIPEQDFGSPSAPGENFQPLFTPATDPQSQFAPKQRTPSPTYEPSEFSFSNEQAFRQQSENEIVRVLDPDGNLVASPFGGITDALPLSSDGLRALRNKEDWWETQNFSGNRLLVYNRPVIFENRVVHILQIARSLNERDQSLKALGSTLVIAILIATLAAFGIGWVLSGITLRPIRQISQTAKEIGSKRDFTQRVTHSGPADEVGQLAMTFNTMLTQLQDAYQKLAHSLEMQRNFVADVSHELRTPLTTLRGNLGLLMRKPPIPPEDQIDILNDMVDESDRLIRLVNDLLVMARAETRRALTKEPITISLIAEEICRQIQHLDPARQISVNISEQIVIFGDRDAMKQILLILLDNALKHSNGAIILAAEIIENQVQIRVKNFGEGIPANQIEHIFDRYYRGEGSYNTQGLGLGLPIAKELVEAQGGKIAMHSELDKGSTIILYFPMISVSCENI